MGPQIVAALLNTGGHGSAIKPANAGKSARWNLPDRLHIAEFASYSMALVGFAHV